MPANASGLTRLRPSSRRPACSRAILLRHFGEDPPERCGNCDNCLDPPATIDVTEVARKLLSAAFRTEMRFGVGHLADVLAGNDNEKVRSFGHDRLSVFGIATPRRLPLVRPVARALIARDALRADAYGGLSFGPGARADPEGRAAAHHRRPAAAQDAPPASATDGPADPLFDALREARRKLAAGSRRSALRHLPRFDAARDRGAKAARTSTSWRRSQGVGAAKLERYGEAMLEALSTNG